MNLIKINPFFTNVPIVNNLSFCYKSCNYWKIRTFVMFSGGIKGSIGGLIRDQCWLNSTFNGSKVNVSYKECQGKEVSV